LQGIGTVGTDCDSRCSANRFRQLSTVLRASPNSAAITWFSRPSAAASTIRACVTSRAGAVRFRAQAGDVWRSASLN